MTTSEAFLDFLRDALAGLGPVVVRRMFGGAGISCDGVMFALVADNTLYLKADAESRAAFEAEGLGPFVYEGRGKPVAMSYWRAPERLLDESDELLAWARTALAVAHREATAKPRRAKRKMAARKGR
jgi:DNA transformation protein and related proteins